MNENQFNFNIHDEIAQWNKEKAEMNTTKIYDETMEESNELKKEKKNTFFLLKRTNYTISSSQFIIQCVTRIICI